MIGFVTTLLGGLHSWYGARATDVDVEVEKVRFSWFVRVARVCRGSAFFYYANCFGVGTGVLDNVAVGTWLAVDRFEAPFAQG